MFSVLSANVEINNGLALPRTAYRILSLFVRKSTGISCPRSRETNGARVLSRLEKMSPLLIRTKNTCYACRYISTGVPATIIAPSRAQCGW